MNHHHTIKNFIVGPCNRVCMKAVREVIRKKYFKFPLIIQGRAGCGKTHLLNAICNDYLRTHPYDKVMLTSICDFVQNFRRYMCWFDRLNLILIDDFQDFLNCVEWTEEFMKEITVRVALCPVPIIATTTETSSDGMATKVLSNSSIVTLQPLHKVTARKWVRYQLKRSNIRLPGRIKRMVMTEEFHNVSELRAVFQKSITDSILLGKSVTRKAIKQYKDHGRKAGIFLSDSSSWLGGYLSEERGVPVYMNGNTFDELGLWCHKNRVESGVFQLMKDFPGIHVHPYKINLDNMVLLVSCCYGSLNKPVFLGELKKKMNQNSICYRNLYDGLFISGYKKISASGFLEEMKKISFIEKYRKKMLNGFFERVADRNTEASSYELEVITIHSDGIIQPQFELLTTLHWNKGIYAVFRKKDWEGIEDAKVVFMKWENDELVPAEVNSLPELEMQWKNAVKEETKENSIP